MKWGPMKWAGRIALALLALLVLGVGWASLVGLPFKSRIQEAVERASGRQLTIAGPLRLALLPRPGIVAEQVTLRGPGPVTEVAAGRIQLIPDLAALLSGRPLPSRLVAQDAFLVAAGQAVPGFVLPRLAVDWTDDPDPGRRIAVSGMVALSGQAEPFQLSGVLADPAGLRQAGRPWPFSLLLSAPGAGAQVTVAGALGQGRLEHLDLTAAVPDLVRLAPQFPDLVLPALRDLALTARLEGTATGPAVVALTLRAGAGVLESLAPGLALETLGVAAAAADAPIRVDARGAWRGQPWSVAGEAGTLAAWTRRQPLRLSLDAAFAEAASLAARVTLARAARPSIEGSLAVARLDLDALRAALPPPPAPPPDPAPSPPPAAPRRVIPDLALPVAPVRALDVHLDIQAGRIAAGGLLIEELTAALRWRDGIARIEDLTARLLGGLLSGRATLDATEGRTAAALSLALRGADVARLAALLRVPDAMAAPLDAELALAGPGETLPLWLAQASGVVALASDGGSIDGAWLRGLLPEAAQRLIPPDPADRALRCVAARLDVDRGAGAVTALLLDGAGVRLAGTGRVNLAEETMEVPMRVQLRLGAGSPVLPGVLAGPWRGPRLRLDAATGLLGLLPGLVEAMPECAPSLSTARGAPVAPAPPVAPALPGLLRDLLRRQDQR